MNTASILDGNNVRHGQALALLKDPALRDVNGALTESIAIRRDARGKARQKLTTAIDRKYK